MDLDFGYNKLQEDFIWEGGGGSKNTEANLPDEFWDKRKFHEGYCCHFLANQETPELCCQNLL